MALTNFTLNETQQLDLILNLHQASVHLNLNNLDSNTKKTVDLSSSCYGLKSVRNYLETETWCLVQQRQIQTDLINQQKKGNYKHIFCCKCKEIITCNESLMTVQHIITISLDKHLSTIVVNKSNN